MSDLDYKFLDEAGLLDVNEDSEDELSEEEKDDEQLDNDVKQNISSEDVDDDEPWTLLSKVSNKQVICSSRFDKVQIFKVDARTLLDGNWLNDQVLNFFFDSGNNWFPIVSGNQDNVTGRRVRTSFMANTWFFSRLARMSVHGEMLRYDYASVRRYMRLEEVDVWYLRTICIPIHILASHWLCCIIQVSECQVLVIDSSPGILTKEIVNRIGVFCRNWYRDELESSKIIVTNPTSEWYISNPIEREQAVQYINRHLHAVPSFSIVYETIWHQTNQNDCGVYTILAMYYFYLGNTIYSRHPSINARYVSTVRKVLLDFFKFKYLRKSDTEFDPTFLFNLS